MVTILFQHWPILRIRTTLRVVKTATVAAVCAALALTACGGSGSGSGSGSPGSSSSARPSYVVAKVDVGRQPCAVEGGFGSIWVSLYGEDTELRIDPATR